MSTFKYLQFASPFQSKRKVLSCNDIDKYWDEAKNENTGRTWQFFDDNLKDYFDRKGTTSGYRGMSDSPIVPIDIDSPDTTNIKRVIDKLGSLLGCFENINLYYSGKKGYHLEIPSSSFAIKLTSVTTSVTSE